jgi:hypothetical protein
VATVVSATDLSVITHPYQRSMSRGSVSATL